MKGALRTAILRAVREGRSLPPVMATPFFKYESEQGTFLIRYAALHRESPFELMPPGYYGLRQEVFDEASYLASERPQPLTVTDTFFHQLRQPMIAELLARMIDLLPMLKIASVQRYPEQSLTQLARDGYITIPAYPLRPAADHPLQGLEQRLADALPKKAL